jgi:type II secretory pathway component PulM
MRAYWDRLSERERLFVSIGGALAALLLVAQLLVAPAAGWRAAMTNRREKAESLYRVVAEASAAAGVASAPVGADASAPVMHVVTESAADRVEIVFRNARPDGGVDANVTADPEKLFEWLTLLETRYGVAVVAADIAREPAGGVRAQLTFARRGAL